ncbi:MAG TPA: ATP-binding protein [Caulobacteraceae bacterium]|jgi:signal transduction histidine kinase|nr:ATP-binding protein [Caulobacteraceae bacterium]
MRRLPALPLFLQTLCLVIITLVVAQILAVAVILNLPPPPPLVYTVAEVAQVVRTEGEPAGQASRVLQVHGEAGPPALVTVGRRRVHFRDALAQALNLTTASIVVDQSGTRIVALDGRPRAAPPREMLRDAPEPLLMGAFKIGVRRADGRWLVVSPRTALGIDPWQQRLLLVLALSVLAVSPLAWLFSRRIAAPIAALAAGAERLGRDPLAPPLDLSGSAEVAAAAAAFNEMQQRLRRYVDERVGMLGAIAHDLRTPLTRVRFRVETTPDPLRAKLIKDIDQMEAMVASVLGFVRDAGQPRDRRKVDLASLVETVMDEAALTGSDAAASDMDRLVVEADPLALKRLLVNLVDNALKFGGSARARVFARAGEAVTEIDDDGPGMPDGDLDRVFEPFRRLEGSRSRETGGIGLGLSVVRAIARGHGGEVILSNRSGGGLRATVTLPLCTTARSRHVADAPTEPVAARLTTVSDR